MVYQDIQYKLILRLVLIEFRGTENYLFQKHCVTATIEIFGAEERW
jgi:hypothetical protein